MAIRDKKKILIIIGSLEIGGTEKQLLRITRRLCKYFSFTIVTFQKKGFIYKEFKKLDINLIDVSVNKKYFRILKIFLIILSICLDSD